MPRDASASPWPRQQRLRNAREAGAIDHGHGFGERDWLLNGAARAASVDDMLRHALLTLVAVAATGAVCAGPAGAQTPTDTPAPGAKPGACRDLVSPTAGFNRRAARKAARHSARRRILRGTARDIGCGMDRVTIAVSRKARGRCRLLTTQRRLSHRTRCARHRWLPARGSTRWSFRLPRRLPKGLYVIRIRALDFAGNASHPGRHRIRLK
jgi:hypothetical protein